MSTFSSKAEKVDDMPVVSDPADFDHRSGNYLERLIFNNRLLILMLCLGASLFLGWHALKLGVNANYEEMFPKSHAYVQNFLDHRRDLIGLGNTMRIAVENTQGDIFDPEYLNVLRDLTDGVITTKGVARGWVKSIWLPSVRWSDATAEGYAGGTVMPNGFDGSKPMIDQLRLNIQRAKLVGSLVSTDMKSSMIVVPLIDYDPDTGRPLDYVELTENLNRLIGTLQSEKVRIHEVGFAVLMGQLIAGLYQVMLFFAAAVVISTAMIYFYTRCIRSTIFLLVVSLLGVVWLLGLVSLMGHALNPYSILVPFLVFAIGISHGAQRMNGISQDIARGTHPYVAARYTFRRLFLAGLTALLTNVFGFAVLMVVDIPMIREMAMITSIGVAVLILTKLVLIPVGLSYIGVSRKAALRRLAIDERQARGEGFAGLYLFEYFTRPRWASGAVIVAALVAGTCWIISSDLQVGDLDSGAPELRADSKYNVDADFVNRHFGLSTDQFAVIVKTEKDGALRYDTLLGMQRLGSLLRQDPDVLGVVSLAEEVPYVNMGQFEANPKWLTIPRSENAGAAVYTIYATRGFELQNFDYSVMPVIAYLSNHKAGTLDRLLKKVETFASEHGSEQIQFLPAAGSAGIEAVTNIVVREAHREMLLLLYGAVIVLCLVTFRDWRAVVIAVIPLLITFVICEALMVGAGIGLKVATLPAHALGVGVGVDYSIYLLSVQLAMQRSGASLRDSYRAAIGFTGRIVALIGLTMSAGVITWIWSPIKFQADMGILLAFMFLWNMIGALILTPALSYFLIRSKKQRSAVNVGRESLTVLQP